MRSGSSSLSSELVLASRSPQRKAILEQLGIPFRIEVPDVEELTEGDPREVVRENALRKAAAVPGERVLGVDTEVVLDGEVLGKPESEEEAAAYLRRLSGRAHEVMSGIALGDQVEVAVTEVRFRELSEAAIERYVASGEWRERAGGYAIQGQGAALVEGITGDYFNVVGLPVPHLIRLCQL